MVRRGAVRRAKLYYLRELRGKKARIAEKVERRVGKNIVDEVATNPIPAVSEDPASPPDASIEAPAAADPDQVKS